MPTQRTANAKLEFWEAGDRNWHVQYENTCTTLDALAAVGGLAVTLAEVPSTSLNVKVAAGDYILADGTLGNYAGTSSFAVTASATRNLWLTDAGVLTAGAAWPAANHVRLAVVVAGAVTITSITDARVPFASAGVAGGGGGGAPTNATYITQTSNATLTNEQALGSLATGILKNTTTTGVLSIAAAGTDYLAPTLTTKGDILTRDASAFARLGVGSDGQVLTADGAQTLGIKWATISGTGTVTSVALSLPAIITVSGSPVTAAGTLTGTLANQTANTVFAGATSGGAAAPTFRALVAADIPNLDTGKLTTGTLATARLGSGTADATTFLRGDQTWATPAGGSPGGSSGQVQYNNASAFGGAANLIVGASANLRLAAQSAPGSPTAGDLWTDSTQQSLTTYQGGMRLYGVGALFVATADVTIANTTAETTLVSGTAIGTNTIPANFLVVGKTLRYRLSGHLSTTGTPTLEIKFRFPSGTVFVTTGAIALAGTVSNNHWECECILTCRTTGAGGTVKVSGKFLYDNSTQSGKVHGMATTSSPSYATNSSGTPTVTAQWGTANVSNTITCTNCILECLG